ncbi:hypothetical protein ACROYT_G034854 [Oculina patagonica]
MGGGDLNLKKSWHPQTLRNVERVWKAEQKAEAETKKIEQLRKELEEERAREDMQRHAVEQGIAKKKGERLDWMYAAAAGQVDHELYLLGKPVDKAVDPMAQENEEESTAPGASFMNDAGANTANDLAAKVRDDPLFLIKKKEEEKRKELLHNPVKMKQLKQMLQANLEKSKKKKKDKKKKSKKEKDGKAKRKERHAERSYDSEEDTRELAKENRKSRSVRHRKRSEESEEDMRKMTKENKKRRHERHRERSEESEEDTRERMRENKKRRHVEEGKEMLNGAHRNHHRQLQRSRVDEENERRGGHYRNGDHHSYRHRYIQQMAAARYSTESLQDMMEENLREFQRNPQRNSTFLLAHTDFNEWLRVWKMSIPENDRNNKDLYTFARKNKKKFSDLLKSEIEDLKSIKASFGLEVKFSKETNGVTQHMSHYFREREPHVFTENKKDEIKTNFDNFIEKAKGEIESWSERGSGWAIERITEAYINVANYQPLRGGTYLPLPPKLAKKKALINVRNKDNQCLKWALRAALFPPKDGKDAQRPSKYPADDGIDYSGIDFPTPLKQLDRLEAKNPKLAMNVFGWVDGRVIPLRISEKEKSISRICLMLIESGETQHYCFVKRVSALLYDQSKSHNKKHFCMLCLTGFSRADLLENHEKYCNGVNGRPTRIEMPEEGNNTLYFKNYHKQMKVPFVIYADCEALLRKMQGCKRETSEDRQKQKEHEKELEDLKQKSYTEKTEQHEACGFSYTVVRSDGKSEKPFDYRGENAMEVFLNCLLIEEQKIRHELSKREPPIVMTWKDWEKFKKATVCHICEGPLMKQNFLDSLPVWIGDDEETNYFGQLHKKCYYEKQKTVQSLAEQDGPKLPPKTTEYYYCMKKLTKKRHKEAAKNQKNCLACHKPLIQPSYKDVVKDHCHITGKYRGAAHNLCNLLMRINPKAIQIPVLFHNLKGYDSHHLMQAMSKISKEAQKEVKCVANNMEKYITFSLGGLRFIDTFNFLPQSLDSLVEGMPKEELELTKADFEKEKFELLTKKGVFPHGYMNSWE